MTNGCYPYYSNYYFHGNKKYRCDVVMHQAWQNQSISLKDSNSSNGIRYDLYEQPITSDDCINRLLRQKFNIPQNKDIIKKISVSYIFPAPKSRACGDYIKFCVNPLNIKNKQSFESLVSNVLGIFSSYLNIDFIPTYISNTMANTIRIGLSQKFSSNTVGSCIRLPSNNSTMDYGGDIWISYEHFMHDSKENVINTLLHEIGHALGLSHPHDEQAQEKSVAHRRCQTWGDHGYFTVMSYKEPYMVNLMKHDIEALQRQWGRRRPITTPGLSLVVSLNAKNYSSFLRDGKGISSKRHSGTKVYDDANIYAVDCSQIQSDLLIDSSGVYDRCDDNLINRYPAVMFSKHVDPKTIIDGRGSDRILIKSQKNQKKVVFCWRGNDRISGGQGDETIVFGSNHGDVTIHDNQGLMKIALLIPASLLSFSRLDNHLLITNLKTKNVIKIINAFSGLGRIVVYDKFGFSQNHKQLFMRVINAQSYSLLQQKFNPDELHNPIYGYDIYNKAMILRGHWGMLSLTATPRIEKIILADRSTNHLSSCFMPEHDFVSDPITTDVSFVNVDSLNPELALSILAIRDIQKLPGKILQIIDKSKQILVLPWSIPLLSLR